MATRIERIMKFMALSVMVLASTTHANAQIEDKRILLPSEPGRSLTVTPPDTATRVAPVAVNVDLLQSLRVNQQFDLPLHDRDYRALITQLERGITSTIITGELFGVERGQFTIAVVDDAVAGWFFAPGHPAVSLRYGGTGVHYIHETDEQFAIECGGGRDGEIFFRERPHLRDRDRNEEEELARLLDSSMPVPIGSCQPLQFNYLDTLIVYTTLARQQAGSVNAIRAEAALAVANMNLAFGNSSIPARTRIVRYLEVGYSENGNYEAHLDRLTDPNDGVMDNAHTVRDDAGADFVALLVADSSSGGLAWCTSSSGLAFSVTRWAQAASSFTLAHEMGHNLGCAHNPEDVDCYPNTNARGHWFNVPQEGQNRNTIMSYSVSGSSRIPYFSSPSITYLGVAVGTATRDNTGQILSQNPVSETFRSTRMDVWLDFSHLGLQFGTFNLPYNSLNAAINRIQPGGEALPVLPILHIKSSSSSGSTVISKAMEIRTCGGAVVIGQ